MGRNGLLGTNGLKCLKELLYNDGRRDEQPERRALCPRVEAGRPLLDALAHLPPVRAARAAAVVVGEPQAAVVEQQKELEAEERRISNQKAAAAAAGLTHEELAC